MEQARRPQACPRSLRRSRPQPRPPPGPRCARSIRVSGQRGLCVREGWGSGRDRLSINAPAAPRQTPFLASNRAGCVDAQGDDELLGLFGSQLRAENLQRVQLGLLRRPISIARRGNCPWFGRGLLRPCAPARSVVGASAVLRHGQLRAVAGLARNTPARLPNSPPHHHRRSRRHAGERWCAPVCLQKQSEQPNTNSTVQLPVR